MKTRPKVGDFAWQVDWCAGVPINEYGESDMDRADERCETYPTKETAVKRANTILPLDAFGSVLVTPVVFTPYDDDDAVYHPHVGFWQPRGDSISIEGD